MEDNKKDQEMFLMALAFLGVSFLIYSFVGEGRQSSKSFSSTNIYSEGNEKINHELNRLQLKKENQRLSGQLRSMRANKIGASDLEEVHLKSLHDSKVRLENGVSFEKVKTKMGAHNVELDHSLEAEVQANIALDLEDEKQRELQEAAFVKNYIAEARARGLKVTVDKDLNVKSVKPLNEQGAKLLERGVSSKSGGGVSR